ncbi:YjjG family noncanonical pyrimidine nucleotidase [Bdellovibrio bacteriovorus]|uniref:YjjG family noncanonical pyrimidine nucleotidase n=1 Tax=Bdellovibrio bacteriovorus TaxID=959 RepID=UPI0021CF4D24|nr:YjjG family noncanonical pyrimidine nucleotidase [Bdellovibrio bacteriovorus]UXR63504.1 YjjG family noncanonical pyrimidine nucleotidase [Bdellovibrio bacteriovorus]
MVYDLFLFDLDDTLLDFKESERRSFVTVLKNLGVQDGLDELYRFYQIENRKLWTLFEEARTSKEHLKVERFRRVFEAFKIEADPAKASDHYLETLPETVVLMDHAEEICQWLADRGEIGIITNGMHAVQMKRIENSKLAPYISFTSVSEECGYAKPDVRFFEHSAKMARKFHKDSAVVIGDRMETDILGARNFGLRSCWFNPEKTQHNYSFQPDYEISHLSEIQNILKK